MSSHGRKSWSCVDTLSVSRGVSFYFALTSQNNGKMMCEFSRKKLSLQQNSKYNDYDSNYY